MGAPLGASDRVGRDTDVTRPTSDRFADNYKPRNASAFVYALIAFLLVAVCCIMFSFAIGSDNVASALPLAQDYLSQESAETILRIGLGMLLPCALLLSIEIWLRHFMPMRHEVINDFVRGMQNCGVIPPDLKTDEIKW
ncbi:MAG: hypothetical protein IJ087_14735, partial [Eggerthellaceae bacterium]|nr:hypothetical protein [Eggerthellaceae bacterium]